MSSTALAAIDDVTVAPGQVTARKTVRATDPYLAGHFPELTVYPGVFTLETICQAVGAAIVEPIALRRVRSVRFLAPLLDGDTMTVAATITPVDGEFDVTARCTRADGVLVARARLRFGEVSPRGA